MILKRAVAVSTPTASRVRFDLNSKTEKRIVTSAKYKAEVMTSDAVRMTVGSVSPLTFKLRDYVEYDGQYYFLNLLPTSKKEGLWKYTYDMDLEGAMYELGRVVFKIDPAYGFDYIGTMYEICNFITRSLEQANMWLKISISGDYPGVPDWTDYFVFQMMTENGVQWKSVTTNQCWTVTPVRTIDDTSQWQNKKANYKGQVTIRPEVGAEITVLHEGLPHNAQILEIGGTWSLNFERDALTANSNIVATKEELCSFDQHTCLAVLQELMNTYEGWQWEVRYNGDTVDNNKPMLVDGRTCVGGVLYLRKSETGFHKYVANSGIYPVDNDFAITEDWELSYGKGNGLKNIKRSYVNDGYLPTKIYCYGSNQNVPSTYRSTRICLPNKEQNESYVRVDDSETPDWIDVNAENEETEVVKVFDEATPANKPFEVAEYTGKTVSVLGKEEYQVYVPQNDVIPAPEPECTQPTHNTWYQDTLGIPFNWQNSYSAHLLIYRVSDGVIQSNRNIKKIGFKLYRTWYYLNDYASRTRTLYLFLSQDSDNMTYKASKVLEIDYQWSSRRRTWIDLEFELDEAFMFTGSRLNVCILDDTGQNSYCRVVNMEASGVFDGTKHPVESNAMKIDNYYAHVSFGSDTSLVGDLSTQEIVPSNNNFFGLTPEQLTRNGFIPQMWMYYEDIVTEDGYYYPAYRNVWSTETLNHDVAAYTVYNGGEGTPYFDFWVYDREYDAGERHPKELHNFFDIFARWKDDLLDPADAGDMYLDWEFGTYNEWRTLHYNNGQTQQQNKQRYLDYWVNRYAYRQNDGSYPVVTFLTGECAGMSFTITGCSWELWKSDGTSGGGYETDDEGQYYHWLGKKYFRIKCMCNSIKDEVDTETTVTPDITSGIYPKAGDEFIIENISMPAMYTYYQGQGDEFSAEAQLQAAADKYIEQLTDKFKYDVEIATDYLVNNSPVFRKFDKIRLTDNAIVESKTISGNSVVTNHYKDVTVTSVEHDLIKPDCKIEVSNYKGRKNITIAIANAMSNNVNYR
jgi:hypothetical protein